MSTEVIEGPRIGPALWDVWPEFVEPVNPPGATLDERFAAFHAANPHVLERLRGLALGLARRGQARIGVKALVEVLRWQHATTSDNPHGWKLNNSHTSRYARLLLDTTPELAGRIETRELRT